MLTVGVVDRTDEENLRICEGRDEAGNPPTSETFMWIEQNSPHLAQDVENDVAADKKSSRGRVYAGSQGEKATPLEGIFKREKMKRFIAL